MTLTTVLDKIFTSDMITNSFINGLTKLSPILITIIATFIFCFDSLKFAIEMIKNN